VCPQRGVAEDVAFKALPSVVSFETIRSILFPHESSVDMVECDCTVYQSDLLVATGALDLPELAGATLDELCGVVAVIRSKQRTIVCQRHQSLSELADIFVHKDDDTSVAVMLTSSDFSKVEKYRDSAFLTATEKVNDWGAAVAMVGDVMVAAYGQVPVEFFFKSSDGTKSYGRHFQASDDVEEMLNQARVLRSNSQARVLCRLPAPVSWGSSPADQAVDEPSIVRQDAVVVNDSVPHTVVFKFSAPGFRLDASSVTYDDRDGSFVVIGTPVGIAEEDLPQLPQLPQLALAQQDIHQDDSLLLPPQLSHNPGDEDEKRAAGEEQKAQFTIFMFPTLASFVQQHGVNQSHRSRLHTVWQALEAPCSASL